MEVRADTGTDPERLKPSYSKTRPSQAWNKDENVLEVSARAVWRHITRDSDIITKCDKSCAITRLYARQSNYKNSPLA